MKNDPRPPDSLDLFDPLAATVRPLAAEESIERIATRSDIGSAGAPSRFVVYSIHDGDIVPSLFGTAPFVDTDRSLAPPFAEAFVRERDFGADAVAAVLAERLGIASRLRVRLARNLLDAGRFFGIDDGHTEHTSRLAVPAAVGEHLDDARYEWLEEAHDRIEQSIVGAVEAAGPGAFAIGVHTYDPRNADGSPRPEIALLDLPESVRHGRPTIARYVDPELSTVEFRATADPEFLGRIANALELCDFTIGRNHPYSTPDGSIEVRIHHAARRNAWHSATSLGAIVIEVRKDLLFEGSDARGYFTATRSRDGAASRIGDAIAAALARASNIRPTDEPTNESANQ